MICDVGWGATIQAALERILRAEGVDVAVVGLYLALSEPGEDRSALGHRLLSYLPNEIDDPDAAIQSRSIAHHADTVERLLMPATGTFVDVTEDGTAITASRVEPHPISLLSAAELLETPGFSFTWRMYLPLPSSKPAGSGSAAPWKNPTLTWAVNALT